MTLPQLIKRSLFIIMAITALNACGDDSYGTTDYSTVPAPYDTTASALITSDIDPDLKYYVIEEGESEDSVTIRDQIYLHYTGRRTNGEIFDSSYKNGNLTPYSSTITGFVDGFTEGLLGMEEGEKRVLIIPPKLGYGASEGFYLQNDTLIFDVYLVEIY